MLIKTENAEKYSTGQAISWTEKNSLFQINEHSLDPE